MIYDGTRNYLLHLLSTGAKIEFIYDRGWKQYDVYTNVEYRSTGTKEINGETFYRTGFTINRGDLVEETKKMFPLYDRLKKEIPEEFI